MATKQPAEVVPAEGWGAPQVLDLRPKKDAEGKELPTPTIPENWVGTIWPGYGMPQGHDNRSEDFCRKFIAEHNELTQKAIAKKAEIVKRAQLAELETRAFKREEAQGYHKPKDRSEFVAMNERLGRLQEVMATATAELKELDAAIQRYSTGSQKAEFRIERIKAEKAEAELLARLRAEVGPLT